MAVLCAFGGIIPGTAVHAEEETVVPETEEQETIPDEQQDAEAEQDIPEIIEEGEEPEITEQPEEEIDLSRVPEDLDFSSMRLILAASDPDIVEDDEALIAEYDGLYLMQYASVEDAMKGYVRYMDLADFVEPDIEFTAAEGEAGDTGQIPMDENNNPLSELADRINSDAEQPASTDKRTVALIDSGAAVDDNVISAVSMIGADAGDDNGHGSEMVRYIVTEDHDAEIISIKVLDADGRGSASAIYAGIEYAIEKGADIINLSLSAFSTAQNAAIKDAVRHAAEAGIIVVGAAGNNGKDVRYFVPGNIDEVLVVGAADENGTRLPSSNYGATVDFNVIAAATSEAAARMSGVLSAIGETAMRTVVNDGHKIFTTDYIKPEVPEETPEPVPAGPETDPVEETGENRPDVPDERAALYITRKDLDKYAGEYEASEDYPGHEDLVILRYASIDAMAESFILHKNSNDTEKSGIYGKDDPDAVNSEFYAAGTRPGNAAVVTKQWLQENYSLIVDTKSVSMKDFATWPKVTKGTSQTFEYSNIGTYNGEKIGARLTVTPTAGSAFVSKTTFQQGLVAALESDGVPQGNVSYEFYYMSDPEKKAIRLENAYMTFGSLIETDYPNYDGEYVAALNDKDGKNAFVSSDSVLKAKTISGYTAYGGGIPTASYVDDPAAETYSQGVAGFAMSGTAFRAMYYGTGFWFTPSTYTFNEKLTPYYTLTINYLEKGTDKVLAERYGPAKQLQGSSYDVKSPAVSGYALADASLSSVKGTMPAKNLVIDVYYEKKTYDLTVNYLEEGTNKVLAPKHGPEKLDAGVKYTVASPEVAGYELVDAKQKTVSGTMPEKSVNIDVFYRRVPQFSIRKNVYDDKNTDIDGKIVAKDSRLHYVISVKNEEKTVNRYRVIDSVPANSEYASGSASHKGQLSDNKIVWDALEIKAGETVQLSFDVTAKGSGRKAVIENTAQAQCYHNDALIKEPKKSNTVINYVLAPIDPEAMQKGVFDTAEHKNDINGRFVKDGDTLFYSITVFNPAREAKDFKVSDILDEDLEFVSVEGGTYDEKTRTITWTRTVDAEKDASFDFAARAKGDGVSIENTANVEVDENSFRTNTVRNWTPEIPHKKVLEDSNDINGMMRVPGQKNTYEIEVYNPADEAKAFIITDDVDEHLQIGRISDEGKQDGQKIVWTVEVDAGETKTVSFDAIIKEGAKNISNTAFINVDDIREIPTDTVKNPILPEPVKKVSTKDHEDADRLLVDAGAELTYTIHVENTAAEPKHFTVRDEIAPGTEVIKIEDDFGKAEKNVITWKWELPAGETYDLKYTVRAVLKGNYIPNEAVVETDDVSRKTNTVENWVPDDPIKKVFGPDGKDADGKEVYVQRKETYQYQISFKNPSDMAKQYTVTDTLDEKASFSKLGKVFIDNKEAKAEGKYDKEKHEIEWKLDVPANGEASVSFYVIFTDDVVNVSVLNDAIVRTDEHTGMTNIVENPLKDDPVKIELKGEKIWKDSSDSDGTRPDHIIVRLYQNGELYKTQKVTGSGDVWSCAFTGLPKYLNGPEAEYTVDEEKISGYIGQTDGTKLINTAIYPVRGDLVTVTKSSDPASGTKVQPGQIITYKLTVKNTGASDSGTTTITDAIPEGMTYITGSANGNAEYRDGGLMWKVGMLKPGAAAELTFKAKVNDDARNAIIKNHAVYSTDTDRTSGKKNTNETVHVTGDAGVPPVLDVLKSSNKTGYVINGDTIIYTLRLKNNGGISEDTVITDEIPAGTAFVSAKEGTYNAERDRVEWYLGTVEAGGERTVRFTVKVTAKEGRIFNQARFGNDIPRKILPETEPSSTSNIVEHVMKVSSQELAVTKHVTPNTDVNKGSVLTYTIDVKNTSDESASFDTVITDQIPEGTEFVSAGNGGTYNKAKNRAEWYVGTLDAGKTARVTYKVKVTVSTGFIRNTAKADNNIPKKNLPDTEPTVSSNEVVTRVTALRTFEQTSAGRPLLIAGSALIAAVTVLAFMIAERKGGM